jgi:VWFA-related protein
MKYPVAFIFFCLSLIPNIAFGQIKSQSVKHSPSQAGARIKHAPAKSGALKSATAQSRPLKICQGVPIPAGYVIVAYETSSACPHGAYVLKNDNSLSPDGSADKISPARAASSTPAVSRPRRARNSQTDVVVINSDQTKTNPTLSEPALSGTPSGTNVSKSAKDSPSSAEEIGPGDVVRIDTNLVSVPVSVLDRQGRFIPNLRRENFRVFEPTEKPFTVALLLDTSGSTAFHLSDIKEAAITFAKQLRPQDRVLVVTFDERVVVLTEATNNLDVVTNVIERYANTGSSTRLYDAIHLVINERLNEIKGRKAMVLFTDGVDTASFQATYQSTLRDAEELDALIYPIEYDTTDFLAAMQNPGRISIVTTTSSGWPFPRRSSSRVIYGPSLPGIPIPGTTPAEYRLADQYLRQLADKTGARFYKASDRQDLSDAFAKIAAELRYQYSLGYYPKTSLQEGERRLLKVRVDQPDLAVRARDSYVQRASEKGTP